jgi:ubiquinone/menaquinone biosynthesis C-methylase UbiE
VRFIARLAPGGTIWACDTDPFMVAWMREHLSAAQLERVTPLQTGEHEIALPDASADLAYLINVYHDVEDAPRMLQELRRLLKPGAPLAVVDWKKEPMPHGPAIERRVDGSVIRREMERAGFGRVGEAVQLPFHVFLSGRREPG